MAITLALGVSLTAGQSVLGEVLPTAIINGLTSNPTYGATAQIGTHASITATMSDASTVTARKWGSTEGGSEYGTGTSPTDFTAEDGGTLHVELTTAAGTFRNSAQIRYALAVNTVAPVASGSTSLGDVLSVTNGTWTGATGGEFTYQWTRDGADISEATSSSYMILVADDAADIVCEVTYTNSGGAATASSNTITVDDFAAPSITGVPTISGTEQVGSVLTATAASVTGNPTPTRSWQWNRSGSPVSGATASTYTLVSLDEGETLTVTQTEANGISPADSAISAATGAIAAAPSGGDFAAVFGGANRAGVGRIPISQSTITAGNGSGFYEIVNDGGQNYLQPAVNNPGDATLTLDSTDTATITTLANTMVVLAPEIATELAAAPSTLVGMKVRDFDDTSLTIAIPPALQFDNEMTLEPLNWTRHSTDPRLNIYPVKTGYIRRAYHATPLTNFKMCGFDVEVLTNINDAGMIQLGRPTVNCEVSDCRTRGPNLTTERTAGRLKNATTPKNYGIIFGNDALNVSPNTTYHRGGIMDRNVMENCYIGWNFAAHTNNGTRLAKLTRNITDGVFQRHGLMQTLNHWGGNGNSGETTLSGAHCGWIVADNIGKDICAEQLDYVNGSLPAGSGVGQIDHVDNRIHAGLVGVNINMTNGRVTGNKWAIGGRVKADFGPSAISAATGYKANDNPNAVGGSLGAYGDLDFLFNVFLATQITFELEWALNCYVMMNTFAVDPYMGGSGGSATLRGCEGLVYARNIHSAVNNLDTLHQGVTRTADTIVGYANHVVPGGGAFGASNYFIGPLAPASPDVLTYFDAYEPLSTKAALTGPYEAGAIGTAGYSGLGVHTLTYDPPTASVGTARTGTPTVFTGSQYATWPASGTGTFGGFFPSNSREMTFVMRADWTGSGDRVSFSLPNTTMEARRLFSGKVRFTTKTGAAGFADRVRVESSFVFDDFDTLHIALKDDRVILAKNGVVDPAPAVTWGDDVSIGFRSNRVILFGNNVGSIGERFVGTFDFMWMDASFHDIETDAGKNAWYTDTGAVRALGSDGSTPTGSAPVLFIDGPATGFATNHGTGPNPTLHGTVTDAGSATAPAAFGSGDWSVATGSGESEIDITLATLPSDGGSAITDNDYSTDAGATWASLGAASTGTYTIDQHSDGTTGTLTASTSYNIQVRAVNAVGDGTASGTKAATTGSAVADLTTVQSTNTTTRNVTVPASPTSGNLLVACCFSRHTSAITETATPSGWTLIHNGPAAASGFGVKVIARVSDGTEGGNTLAMFGTGATVYVGGCVELDVNETFNTLAAANGVQAFATADPPSRTISALTNGTAKPHINVAFYSVTRPTSAITTATYTGQTPDVENVVRAYSSLVSELLFKAALVKSADTAADATIDMGDHDDGVNGYSSNNMVGASIVLSTV